MGLINFSVETVDQVLEDIKPLLQNHWDEIAAYKDKIPLAPNYGEYLKVEKAGNLLICTVRDDGKLVGYSIYFVRQGVHYSKNIVAVNDIFYVAPSHRRRRVNQELVATALIKYAEIILKQSRLVSVISMRIKVWKDWSTLAERQGYKRVEYVHQKYVGD
jgi:GNAT superfamily N-acetyltransferase